ncbi:helix-turn-helix transcriptional regulator [Lachnobacterium bovis]|uniref:helix-turn-helix transcriptional regulator n=1 Tax=Lachnobacterium bovis TaxID=140626 RepID=UPI0003B350F6|nr:response regulator transcription factor [Lachnobacterium bovis]
MYTINYCGYNVQNPDYDTIYRPHGSGDYLLLIIEYPMYFYFKSDKSIVNKRKQINNNRSSSSFMANYPENFNPTLTENLSQQNCCILYTPGTMQYYKAQKKFINSFIHFSCDKEEVEKYNLPLNTIFYPNNTSNILQLIKKIQDEQINKNVLKKEMCSALMNVLFVFLKRSCEENEFHQEKKYTSIYDSFASLRLRMLNQLDHEWKIEELCECTNMGKSQFYVYYRKFFNISPKDDLTKARIDYAKYLLDTQNILIYEISEKCGFKNINHFNRTFKKHTSLTPKEYKKKNT